jgi:hypothetical protein
MADGTDSDLRPVEKIVEKADPRAPQARVRDGRERARKAKQDPQGRSGS